MLDREVSSCIPFFVPVFLLCEGHLSLLARKLLELKSEFWNYKIVLFRTLVLYTGFICSATSVEFWFLTVSSIQKSLLANPIGFLFFGISVVAICLTYLQNLWCYVDFRKTLKSEPVWSTAGNCEVEYLVFPDSYYNIVAVQCDKDPLKLRTRMQF